MSSLSPLSLVVRAFATVAVFAVTGPLTIALTSVAAIAALGAPFFELFTAITGVSISRNWLFISFVLLIGLIVAGSALPSICAGIAFALSAFVFKYAAIAAAWIAAAIVALGFAVAGVLVTPSESSPLILVSIGSIRQALSLALLLFVPAAFAASVAWLLSRPFHRGVAA
ncbi:MAG: hypothetical protein HY242_15530 [Afipia sp.]|nr:hypothetical protein [Afipia sp.]